MSQEAFQVHPLTPLQTPAYGNTRSTMKAVAQLLAHLSSQLPQPIAQFFDLQEDWADGLRPRRSCWESISERGWSTNGCKLPLQCKWPCNVSNRQGDHSPFFCIHQAFARILVPFPSSTSVLCHHSDGTVSKSS